jgi:hypothetical protein
MTKVTINIGKLNQAATEAFKETCFLMGNSFTQVISEPGAFDNFDGDLVDTGQLRSSQQLEFQGDDQAQFSWNTEYALFVYEGYSLRNGGEQPGRPWTTEGLKRFDAQAVFAKLLAAKLR